ncbi:MAG: NAD(P)H-binding protein [Pseudomonadota bacterium]
MKSRTIAALSGCALIVAVSMLLAGVFHRGMAPAQASGATMLKIVVYGGSGAIGSRIVSEALARGHSVTVVDRNPKPVAGPHADHATVIQGDALDPRDIAKNIAGVDVLVSSVVVRPAPTPDFALKVVQSMVAALRTQSGGKKTRLLDVGGASSLHNADGKRIIDTLPPAMVESSRGEVGSSVDALDWLRTVNDVSWTFLSPSMNIRPGTRTGKFRLGTEQLLVDAQGNSAISMEDYAVAMLDEIENPKHLNARFTVGY